MNEYLIDVTDFQLTQKEFFIRLLVSIGIGFLIGLEREHSALAEKEKSFAGIRTFMFLSLLGFMGAMTYYLFAPWVLGAVFAAVVAFTGISYWTTSSKGDIGGTTEFTALLAFFLGSLAFAGYIEPVLAITVIAVVLLSAKLTLQTIIGKITQEELYDFIRYAVAALLIFPFLPDKDMGPFNVINPKEIGWVIILTSGLGFLGYLLIKFLGPGRGILLTGIVGGLVSSTMVTWVFARKSREAPGLSANCATAILAASSIMIIRVMLWIFIFNQALAPGMYLPVGILLLAAVGATFYLYKIQQHSKPKQNDLPQSKPLNLQGALTFGVIYTAIILLVSYTNDRFGDEGIFLSSAISGLADIDAITISVSKLAGGALSELTAQNAILLATLSNTLVKMGIAIWAGSKEIRKYVLIGYGLVFVAGIAAFVVVNL